MGFNAEVLEGSADPKRERDRSPPPPTPLANPTTRSWVEQEALTRRTTSFLHNLLNPSEQRHWNASTILGYWSALPEQLCR